MSKMEQNSSSSNSTSSSNRSVLRSRKVLLVPIVAYVIYSAFKPKSSPVIETHLGKIQGTVAKSRDGHEFYEYVGIPYAQPPLGNLRFEPPVEPKAWNKGEIKQMTRYQSQCLQIDIISSIKLGSENCLYLNVFVKKETLDKKESLPVLFWIYGGGFQSGTSDIYRPHYFMDEDVVFVSINYRLGALGFLNSGDHLIRGNQGMKDLVMGLKWVQRNIKNFGGDPGRVTIFGESAGGGAVHFLMLSPLSKGLFQKAISQSGNVLNAWLYARYPKDQFETLAKRLQCPMDSSKEMVKCLKEIDAREIVETHREMRLPPRPLLGKYAPSVEAVVDETTFLPRNPREMLEKGEFMAIPWMTGADAQEGLPFATEILEQQFLVDWANKDWDDFITKIVFLYIYPNRPKHTAQTLKEYYLRNSTVLDAHESLEGLSRLHAARFFFVSMHETATFHGKKAPVYLYFYDYPTEFGFLKLMRSLRGTYLPLVETGMEIAWHWIQKLLGLPIYRKGSSHGEEMLLQFPFPFIPGAPVGSSDYKISKDLIKSWVSFAYDHNKLKFRNFHWPKLNLRDGKLKYMLLANNSKGMIDEPFSNDVNLWRKLKIV